MRIECPKCNHQIKLEVDIRVKSADCIFCKLSSYQRELIKSLVLTELNVAEYMEITGDSRAIVKKELQEIAQIFLSSANETDDQSIAVRATLSDELITKCIRLLNKSPFSTYPDFIQILEQNHPQVIEKYIQESPRNWRSRIGRKLSAFSRDTGLISKSGRIRNSQLWKVNNMLSMDMDETNE